MSRRPLLGVALAAALLVAAGPAAAAIGWNSLVRLAHADRLDLPGLVEDAVFIRVQIDQEHVCPNEIVVDQIPKLLGVHFDKGSFLNNLTALVQHLPDASIPTLLVGLAMLAILLGNVAAPLIDQIAARAMMRRRSPVRGA